MHSRVVCIMCIELLLIRRENASIFKNYTIFFVFPRSENNPNKTCLLCESGSDQEVRKEFSDQSPACIRSLELSEVGDGQKGRNKPTNESATNPRNSCSNLINLLFYKDFCNFYTGVTRLVL